jgi:putative membrane protein
MTRLFLKYIAFILTIFILYMLTGTIFISNYSDLFAMGLVLLIFNLIIRPFLLLLTLPFSILTLGLFTFVVNAWTIMLADYLVPGVNMGGFLNSLLAAFVMTIVLHFLKDMNRTSR